MERTERGAPHADTRAGALVGIVVLFPVVLLALAAHSQRSLTEMEASRAASRRTRALYLAHAAVQKAADLLQADPAYRGEQSDVPFGDGSYGFRVQGSETIPELEDRYRVRAVGSLDGAGGERTDVRIDVILAPGGRSVLDYAVASRGRVTLNSGSQIGDASDRDNPVYAGNPGPDDENVTVYGQGGTMVYGSADLVTEVLQDSPPGMDPGPIRYGVEPLDFPTYDLDALRQKARDNDKNPQYPGGAHFVGKTTFRNETLRGVIYVDGDVVLRGTVIVDGGCIVCDSSSAFTIAADLTLRPDMDPVTGAPNLALLKVGGNALRLSPARTVDIEGFVLTDCLVMFESDGVVRGGIVADTDERVHFGGSSTVYLEPLDPEDLAEEVRIPQTEALVVEAWVENPDIDPASGPR